jgi:hypothetical protein
VYMHIHIYIYIYIYWGRGCVGLAVVNRAPGGPSDDRVSCTKGQTKLAGGFSVLCSQSLAMDTRSSISLARRSASLSLAAFSSATTMRAVAAVTNGRDFLSVQSAHNTLSENITREHHRHVLHGPSIPHGCALISEYSPTKQPRFLHGMCGTVHGQG